MHRWALLCVALPGLIISACQGPPPTQIVLVVTATPMGLVAQAVATAPPGATSVPVQARDGPGAAPVATTAGLQPATLTSSDATPAPLPGTPYLVQPTPTVRQIQVAEQIFERGRMFWLQPTGQIWVMVVTGAGVGNWYVYEDQFEEGDPESDPELIPPDEDLRQPVRGFGLLWRNNTRLRELLGWGTTDEFGYVTRYEYHPALQVEDGQIVSAPGEHVLYSLVGEGFRFIEESGSWRLN